MKRLSPHHIAVIKFALFIALVVTGCRQQHETRTKEIPELPRAVVQVFTVKTENIPLMAEIPGTVRPIQDVVIAAKVTGTIAEIPVELGYRVEKGDLLLKISAGELAAQALRAQARLEQARRNLKREKELLRQDASTPETVKTMEDMYRVAKAAVEEAETMLGYTTITAPFDGVITRKYVHAGDLATPGTPLLELENNMVFQVEAWVPESLALNLHAGDEMTVRIQAADLELSCRLAEMAPAADPVSRTTLVKFSLPSNPLVRSGQFARIMLPQDSVDTILVPSEAVLTVGQMEKVFVDRDGKAEMRLVQTGGRIGEMVKILAGLSSGERIVVKSMKNLRNGQPLQPETVQHSVTDTRD